MLDKNNKFSENGRLQTNNAFIRNPSTTLKGIFFYTAPFNEKAGCDNTNDTEIIKNINPR